MLQTTVSIQGFTFQLINGVLLYFFLVMVKKHLSKLSQLLREYLIFLADVFFACFTFLDGILIPPNCAFDFNYMEKGHRFLCYLVDPLERSIKLNSFGN